MKESGILDWDINSLSKSLKISTEAVYQYFTDGRRVSFLIERRIALEVLNAQLAPSEGAGYDVITDNGEKWEVRSISKGGVYFCPSYMVGSGRSFNQEGFIEKLNEIQGYVLSDIQSFPNIPFWIIKKDVVEEWHTKEQLGSTTKISRGKIFELIKGL